MNYKYFPHFVSCAVTLLLVGFFLFVFFPSYIEGFCLFVLFLVFLGPHPQYREVPSLGVESAAAAGLRHSHAVSKQSLQPTPQHMATPDALTH